MAAVPALALVAEAPAGYAGHPRGGALGALADAVDRLLACPVDEVDEPRLHAELETLETVRRRIDARVCRAAAALTRRQARHAADAAPTDPRAAEKASRQTQQELVRKLGWSPQQAAEHKRLGDELTLAPETAAAMDAGALSAAHARHLTRTLAHLTGDVRDRAEAELVDAAAHEDPVAFGRRCRRLLATLDHDAAMHDLERLHGQRAAAVTTTPTGMTQLWGQWIGLDAETVATAVDAFRRPDPPGVYRTAGQRTADAVVELCRAALRAADAPTRHGVRPHVVVTVDLNELRDTTGTAEGGWAGPVPVGEVQRLLHDAGLSWVILDGETPVATGAETRTVPVGLWRALVLRDGGCIAEGCDAKPDWTDVMHLATPHAAGGGLDLATAGLGCRTHHRKYDRGNWQVTWTDGRPVLHPPRAGPAP